MRHDIFTDFNPLMRFSLNKLVYELLLTYCPSRVYASSHQHCTLTKIDFVEVENIALAADLGRIIKVDTVIKCHLVN